MRGGAPVASSAPPQVFPDLGPAVECFPVHDYMVTSVLKSGQEIPTANLTQGRHGGFEEARPYTVANFFLCLRERSQHAGGRPIERAAKALNNVIEIYRFLTLDPLARSVRADQDTYYTLVSMAEVPPDAGDLTPQEVFKRLADFQFGSTIGVNRACHIGLNSFDDLISGDTLPLDTQELLHELTVEPHELEIFHQLFFSAVRRLKRREWALAVIDAQSAFESLVSSVLREALEGQGQAPVDIDARFAVGADLHTLQRRLQELDHAARTQGSLKRFLGSAIEVNWRVQLYRLRNEIVHQGRREVTFIEGKIAVRAGLRAAHAIQDLTPSFQRNVMWSGQALDLDHVTESSGRISRMFEV